MSQTFPCWVFKSPRYVATATIPLPTYPSGKPNKLCMIGICLLLDLLPKMLILPHLLTLCWQVLIIYFHI